MVGDPNSTRLSRPMGAEADALGLLADMVATDFSPEDIENPSFQRAVVDTGSGAPTVIQLPGIPDENRDGHIYLLVPSILLGLGARAVAIASVVTRSDGVDGTMTLVASQSGKGFIRLWFPGMDAVHEVHDAVGPQAAALRDALMNSAISE